MIAEALNRTPSFTPGGHRVTLPHKTPGKSPDGRDQEGCGDKDACADDDGLDKYPQKEDVSVRYCGTGEC